MSRCGVCTQVREGEPHESTCPVGEVERLQAKVARYEALLDPDNDERVQRLAERMVRARAAHHGPGFSTWPTAVHAEAAAVLAALREEAGDV